MNRTLAGLCLAGLATLAQAGTPALTLDAVSPTTLAAGGTLELRLTFSQIQERSGIESFGGEPSPDIGFQSWISRSYEAYDERLLTLLLRVAAPGGPTRLLSLAPDTGSGIDYQTIWNLSLALPLPGTYTFTALAEAAQDRWRRSGSETRSRECVGFDNSVQCSAWSAPQENVFEDTRWTETAFVAAAPLQVQVVPEPATAWLWALGLLALGAWPRRRHDPRR